MTPTGRKESEPNLQNIPIRTEEGRRIRLAFTRGTGRMSTTSSCNDPALLSVFLPEPLYVVGPDVKRYEIYINGFKEGELSATDKEVAELRFWNSCTDHTLIALKLSGKARAIIEEKK